MNADTESLNSIVFWPPCGENGEEPNHSPVILAVPHALVWAAVFNPFDTITHTNTRMHPPCLGPVVPGPAASAGLRQLPVLFSGLACFARAQSAITWTFHGGPLRQLLPMQATSPRQVVRTIAA